MNDYFSKPQEFRYLSSPRRLFDLTNLTSVEAWSLFTDLPDDQTFPVAAFPGVAGDFFSEICIRHPELAGLVVGYGVAVTSAATQGHGDVLVPWMTQPRPLGMNVLMGAPPHAGKSFAEDLVAGGCVHVVAKERFDQYQADDSDFKRGERMWKHALKRLEKDLAAAKTADDQAAAVKSVDAHYDCQPKKPRFRPLVVTDFSIRALAELLHGHGEWLAWITSEGGNIADSPLLDDMYKLNDISEGKVVPMMRGFKTNLIARNAGLAMGISMQDEVFIEFLFRFLKRMQDSGFLSRTHLLLHQSAKPLNPSTEPWRHQVAYNKRLLEVLRTAPLCATGPRPVFQFAPCATELLLQIKNGVHAAVSPGGNLADFRSYFVRTPEMIAKQAASYHIVDDRQDLIPVETVQRAAAVISALAKETARVCHKELPAVQFDRDKALVERHVLGRLAAEDGGELGWDALYRSTTTSMRKRPEAYLKVMSALQGEGKIGVFYRDGKRCQRQLRTDPGKLLISNSELTHLDGIRG